MMPAAVNKAARNSAPGETGARSARSRFIFESSVIQLRSFSQTREALTSVAPLIPAVFGPSVTKKPHITLKAASYRDLSAASLRPYIALALPLESSMTTPALRPPYDARLKFLCLLLVAWLSWPVSLAHAADGPD